MNELSNTVTAVGTYNNIPTSLTSNTSIVNIIEGLTITKEADKKNWSDGLLTYEVIITNDTNTIYNNPTVKDIIDTDLIELVKSSITINGKAATEDEYTYNDATHTLEITVNSVPANDKATITFSVKKKTIDNSI